MTLIRREVLSDQFRKTGYCFGKEIRKLIVGFVEKSLGGFRRGNSADRSFISITPWRLHTTNGRTQTSQKSHSGVRPRHL